jgi:Rha family phage regulatory protein
MSDDLIQVKENEILTTSLLVAKTFNKEHKNVIQKIETLLENIGDNLKSSSPFLFQKSEYVTTQNKTAPMYYINRDGFTLLAMRFTGKEALERKIKYLEAFNETERQLLNNSKITSKDNRLDIARLLPNASKSSVEAIKQLYPEYFTSIPKKDSLEYICNVNTSYIKWLEDNGITKAWLSHFPTTDIYNHYSRYCSDNLLIGMSKKYFYETIERDFDFKKKQRGDGQGYFMLA